jgi:HSP20 family protein
MSEKEMVRKEKQEVKAGMGEGLRPGPIFIPPVDIFENKEEIIVLADMPGGDGKNVDVNLKNKERTITGRVDPPQGEKEAALYREFHWGDYYRKFSLSNAIDQGKIAAKMDNGVLRLVLPKAEKMKPQKIKVMAE